jgi:hypothetical protein
VPTGTQFTNIITPMSPPPATERENWIYAQVMSGNIPQFQRTLVPITVSATINGTSHTATYYAAPDCLAIGTDADYFLEPTTPLLAQRLCNALGYTLPTRKMVNQIVRGRSQRRGASTAEHHIPAVRPKCERWLQRHFHSRCDWFESPRLPMAVQRDKPRWRH